jgi:hypothetical protein
MEKPMVDVSKIRAGDVVKMEGRVVQVDPDDRELPIRVKFGDGESEWVKGDRVSEHVPAPREFKIGENVTSLNWGKFVFTVIGVRGLWAWIEDAEGLNCVEKISCLRHVDEPKP